MNAKDLRYLDPNSREAKRFEKRIRTSGIEIGPGEMPVWVDRIDRIGRQSDTRNGDDLLGR